MSAPVLAALVAGSVLYVSGVGAVHVAKKVVHGTGHAVVRLVKGSKKK